MACSLYRFYSQTELLYVGITGVGSHRFKGHRREKEWWPEVSRIDVEHYDTRDEALRAEYVQIQALCPRYNVQHAPTPEVQSGETAYRCSRCNQTFTSDREVKGLVLCRKCQRQIRRRDKRTVDGRRLRSL